MSTDTWTDELDKVYAEAQGVVSWLTEQLDIEQRVFAGMSSMSPYDGESVELYRREAERYRERASNLQQAREQIIFWAGLTGEGK